MRSSASKAGDGIVCRPYGACALIGYIHRAYACATPSGVEDVHGEQVGAAWRSRLGSGWGWGRVHAMYYPGGPGDRLGCLVLARA